MAWQWYNPADTSKGAGTARKMPRAYPSLRCLHTGSKGTSHSRDRWDSQGHHARSIVKDCVLPVTQGKLQLKHHLLPIPSSQKPGSHYSTGRGSCQGGEREREREREVCLQITQDHLQASTWHLQMRIKIRIKAHNGSAGCKEKAL